MLKGDSVREEDPLNVAFNLVDEPWLPCLDQAGKLEILGLRQLFIRSGELAELRAPSPLATAALLRLLLAISHAALRGPKDTAERAHLWLNRDEYLGAVDAYLTSWYGRFDLFHPEHPFYQEAGLRLRDARKISFISLELASPDALGLFDPAIDKSTYVAPAADAARYLITRQAYTLGGLDRAQSNLYGSQLRFENSPPLQGALVFLTGKSVLETLLMNLVPYTERDPIPATGGQSDLPVWERDTLPWQPGMRPPDGYLDYLTWTSGAVLLEPSGEGASLGVRAVHTCARNKLDPTALAGEPFFAWRPTKEGSMPLSLRTERSLWRDSGALFGFTSDEKAREGERVRRPAVLAELSHLGNALAEADEAPEDTQWSLLVIGAESERTRQAVHMWRAESLPLPPSVIASGDALDIVEQAVQLGETVGGRLRGALRSMATRYLSAGRVSNPDPGNVDQLHRSWNAEELYWPALEDPFRRLLESLRVEAGEAEAAMVEWRNAVRTAAWRAFSHAADYLGGNAEALQARIHAERLLAGGLRQLLGGKE